MTECMRAVVVIAWLTAMFMLVCHYFHNRQPTSPMAHLTLLVGLTALALICLLMIGGAS